MEALKKYMIKINIINQSKNKFVSLRFKIIDNNFE